ncbi:tetratricopeptide repeat protein [Candidatus Obscuribacterales bacterium]|nr:tetratricopeptide repeat protein [Candidatus Obscuribacterales bacterium]
MKKAILTLALAAVASSSMSGFIYGPVFANATNVVAPIAVRSEVAQKTVTAAEFQARAEQYIYDYNYRGLIKYCDEVIASNQDLPEAYFFRAVARYNLNVEDVFVAMADLDKAVELNPQFVDALIWIGIISSDSGDHESAIAKYSEALNIDPTNMVALELRMELHDLLQDLDGLEADFTHYISIAPSDPNGYLQRGFVRAQKGDIANAINDLEESSKLLVAEGSDTESKEVEAMIAKLKSGQAIG